MRLAERVRCWFRKLGPSDNAAEAHVTTVQQSNAGEEVEAASAAGAGVAVGATSDSSHKEAFAPLPHSVQPAQEKLPVASVQQPPQEELPVTPAPQLEPQPAQQAPAQAPANGTSGKSMLDTRDFFAEAVHAEAYRYTIKEVIGKGSYGVVCSAVDNFTGEKVAIKKITNVFEHVSDATRIVREIKLLRLLKHPDIVDIKHIMLPPSPKEFRDIYVVFELLETDLHQVIKANDDLTPEHHQFFLYQMLRGLKYIHSAKVFHRDLKPKNILANSDCKLKICDFGLARPAFTDMPTTVFWTDYVATRWYRAPELCGSFFAKYSPAIDIWSVGCIFAEVLLGKPLFPGRNVVHQLELITDLLGTPSGEVIAKVRNEKARRFLLNMCPKPGIPFELHFPRADRGALRLLRRLLAFDPAERPTAEEALADPYFTGLHCLAREPVAQPLSKMAFEFDRRKLTLEDVRELIYREILEYHPQMLAAYLAGGTARPNFHYPSALESFKRQFAHLEAGGAAPTRGPGGSRIYPSCSLPKEWVAEFQAEAAKYVASGPTTTTTTTAAAAVVGAAVGTAAGAAGANKTTGMASCATAAITSSSSSSNSSNTQQHVTAAGATAPAGSTTTTAAGSGAATAALMAAPRPQQPYMYDNDSSNLDGMMDTAAVGCYGGGGQQPVKQQQQQQQQQVRQVRQGQVRHRQEDVEEVMGNGMHRGVVDAAPSRKQHQQQQQHQQLQPPHMLQQQQQQHSISREEQPLYHLYQQNKQQQQQQQQQRYSVGSLSGGSQVSAATATATAATAAAAASHYRAPAGPPPPAATPATAATAGVGVGVGGAAKIGSGAF